jgi:hypothetical protein
MDKFLFTDGTNGVREVDSQAALQALIESSAQPEKIRIWLFSTNEWITYAAFLKQISPVSKKDKPPADIIIARPVKNAGKGLLIKSLYLIAAAAGVFLVFNFTRIKWENADPVNFIAVRPANVPVMDIDSLFYEIEFERGQPIDRNTKNNLRLRNTWPERILLQLAADKETSSAGTRFSNVHISIDNTTGLAVDNAVLKFTVWKDSKATSTDTLRFNTIRFDKLSTRLMNGTYRGDSISVSFETIKAKSFNFCYSATVENNSGNYNDRWFCRE